MNSFRYSLPMAALLVFASSAFDAPATTSLYQFDYENVLGTSFQLKIAANSEAVASHAELVALAEIDRLVSILSTYDPTSEVSAWQKTINQQIEVSEELFEVFLLFDDWKQRSSGVLTASVSPAIKLWENAESDQRVPSANELSLAIEAMQRPLWRLNVEKQTAINLSEQPILLNSFVKSYIIGKVADKLMSLHGVYGIVVNIGGDMVVAGSQTEMVQISNPLEDAENDDAISTLSLEQCAIATSGNYRRGFQIGTKWFSHIIDPRSAQPASHVLSASVVASNATDAGALATAFNILPPEESKLLALSVPGVEYQIITSDGREIVSGGWRHLQAGDPDILPANSKRASPGKLTIEIELATFEGRFRRPFVAVWVENKKKESVRTVAVWYNKPRWLPDLKRWYSKNQLKAQDIQEIASISSATRAAGNYSLVWDGLDDDGNTLPTGIYTIYIEAAREHGTYQLMKQEIEWNGKPKHFDLKGGTEISSASLEISK